MDEEQLEDLWW